MDGGVRGGENGREWTRSGRVKIAKKITVGGGGFVVCVWFIYMMGDSPSFSPPRAVLCAHQLDRSAARRWLHSRHRGKRHRATTTITRGWAYATDPPERQEVLV